MVDALAQAVRGRGIPFLGICVGMQLLATRGTEHGVTPGLDAVALEAAASGRPFLGICVGMQLLYDASEESPGAVGLGILPGQVRRLPEGVKHPQMQWNRLDAHGAGSPLLDGTTADGSPPWMYFVHSFAAEVTDDVVATCDYGGPVAAMAVRGNVVATQFHPEKSGHAGLDLLRNWVRSIPVGVVA
jgi:glutamine amidotransferase